MMNAQQQRGSDTIKKEIEYLIENFSVHIESCRQSAQALVGKYPSNVTILQIIAACQSLSGNHRQAIDVYSKCIQVAGENLAYSNNQAWNYIQLKDYEVAVALLNDIKQKWNHSAIYFNLAMALQNYGQGESQLQDTLKMADYFIRKYPQLEGENSNGLIHTFKLKQQGVYTRQIDRLRTQIFEFTEALQNFIDGPLNFEFLEKRVKQLSNKIELRMQQQQRYGMVIDKQLRATMEGLMVFRKTILTECFMEQYSQELNKYVAKSIEILNENILSIPILEKDDYEKFQNQKIIPCAIQLEQIAIRMKEIVADLEKSKPKIVHEKIQRIKEKTYKIEEKPYRIEEKPYRIEEKPQKIEEKNPNTFYLNQVYYEQESLKLKQEEINRFSLTKKIEKIEQIETKPNLLQNPQQNIYQKQEQKPKNYFSIYHQEHKQAEKNVQIKQNEQIKKELKISKERSNGDDDKQKREFVGENYQFQVRMDEISSILEEDEESVVESLRVQGENSVNPLFFILHFRKGGADIFNVYLNKNRIRRELLNEPELPALERIKDQRQRNKILKYSYILSLLLRFYNYFGTKNFQYKRKNIPSSLETDHFIHMIAPVLDEIFDGEQLWGNTRVGSLCNQIHLAIATYLNQVRQGGSYLRALNHILRKIHSILRQQENPAHQLVKDFLAQKNLEYCNILLNQEPIKIDGSTKYQEYYNFQMNRLHQNHRDSQAKQVFTTDDWWIISNISLLLVALQQKESNSDQQHLLNETFVDCYYSSRVTESTRNTIFRKFYQANHDVAPIQKVGIAFRKLCRKILL